MTISDNIAIYFTNPAVITPLGDTPESFFQALLAGRRGFSGPLHFEAHGRRLGVCHQIDDHEDFDERFSEAERAHFPARSARSHRLLDALRCRLPEELPKRLYLATTVGDIDLVTAGGQPEPDSPQSLLAYAKKCFGADETVLVSSACASGQRAITLAAMAVARGEVPAALVVGCDQCSEFVTSGFGSLSALTADLPSPYDANRSGMTLGEAVAGLIVSREKPLTGLGAQLAGYGESCDAAHITAPDSQGTWLAAAIRQALPDGRLPDAVIGHGTGTIYNDQAELNALQIAFPGHRLPLFSLKGNIGHTLGATGVLQAIAAMGILATHQFPPQAGLTTPAPGAEHSVACEARPLASSLRTILSLNAGFGGLNHVLALTGLDSPEQIPPPILWSSPTLLGTATDATPDEQLGAAREALISRGVLSAEDSADFRRASLTVKHAILAAARLRESLGDAWKPAATTLIGTGGDGVRFSNPSYWQDYVTHGSRRGRGTLFVDTLASIPLCEVAIALQFHGAAGYLAGVPLEVLLRTAQTPFTLVLSASASHAEVWLYGSGDQDISAN